MTVTDRPRPTPLRDVAHDVTLTVGLGGAIVTSLVGYGVLTLAQGNAVTGLLGLIPGIVAGISTAIAAFRTATVGEQHVTPIMSPRGVNGEQLVPVTVPHDGRHEQ